MVKKEPSPKSDADLLSEKYKLVTLRRIGEFRKGLDVLSTGIFALDMACGEIDPHLGNGGIQARSIVELSAENNSYKTGISEWMIKTTLDRYPGKCVAAVYSEAPNVERMEEMGIDIDRICVMGVYHPDIDRRTLLAENALDCLISFSKDPNIKLCVIDSIASLAATKQLFDKNKERPISEGSPVAAQAQVINLFIKGFNQHNELAVLLMLNQYREPISTGFVGWGEPKIDKLKTSAGRGMEIAADLRMMAKTNSIWNGVKHSVTKEELEIGKDIHIDVFKNKYANTRGFRPARFTFNFDTKRINNEEKILAYAYSFGRKEGDKLISELSPPVVDTGSWTYIGDQKLHGKDRAIEYLINNPEISKKLELQLIARNKKFFEQGPPSAGSILDP